MTNRELVSSEFRLEFSMSREQQRFFEAERDFLEALGRKLFPDALSPEIREGQLVTYLEDVCSTEIAEAICLRYGFNQQRQCFSASEISHQLESCSTSSITQRLRVGLQTLWFLHHSLCSPDSEEFVPFLEQRYVLEESACQNKSQREAFRAAQAFIGVYQDRQFFQSVGEKKLLDFLASLYGQEIVEIFAQYYRLPPFRFSRNYGLIGNVDSLSSRGPLSQSRDQVGRAVNLGRAAAEYLVGEPYGSCFWTDGRGRRRQGYPNYKLTQEDFLDKIAKHEKQRQIKKELEESPLVDWEKELLMMTTEAVLSGRPKIVGLRAFNEQYGTFFSLQDVAGLEKEVLEGRTTTHRPHWLEVKNTLGKFLDSQEAQAKLSRQLLNLLSAYHQEARTMSSLVKDYPVSYAVLCHVRIFLEDLCWGRRYGQGELMAKEIELVLGENQLPPVLLEVLREYRKGEQTARTILKTKGLLTTRASGLGGIVRMVLVLDKNKLAEDKA